MPAPKRVPDDQVKEAILAWRGNVKAAAETLGMQPKNLRKRLETMGIDLASLRGLMGAIGVDPIGPHRTPSTPVSRKPREGGHGARSAAGLFSREGRAANFPTVQQPTEVEVQEVKQRKPIRIRPEHQERLRQAKLDYAGKKRIETDETTILAAFIEAKLEEFLAEQLGGGGRKRGATE